MKIRSITLTNFRKFVGTVSVDGIGDGVSVLVGRNEIGKSTILQAINGVIFEKANSTSQRVKGFRHFVNGTVPEVEMRFDLDGATWTIKKRFAGQPGRAVLTSSDRRRFEDEAAEGELQRLLGFSAGRSASEPGIWGTLWVRQGGSFGAIGLDDQARQTLQGCLEAQIGAVTGGARGQRIPDAVETALGEIMSTRGPRGRFKEAKESLDETTKRIGDLTTKRQELFTHMDDLAGRRRELQRLVADWDEEENRNEIATQREAATAAATKAAEIATARTSGKLAEERAEHSRTAFETRNKLVSEVDSLDVKIADGEGDADIARQAKAEAQAAVSQLEQRLVELKEQTRLATERARRLERIGSAIGLSADIDSYEATLTRAVELQTHAESLSGEIGKITTTAAAVTRIEAATTTLAAADAALNAVATTLFFDLSPDAPVKIDGTLVKNTRSSRSVVTKIFVEIEDIGSISIEPQVKDREVLLDDVTSARNALSLALEAADAVDLPMARLASARRELLQRNLAEIQREIATLAPGYKPSKLNPGLDALKGKVAEFRGRLGAELETLGLQELPDFARTASDLANAQSVIAELTSEIEQRENALASPRAALGQAVVNLQVQENALAALRGQLLANTAALAVGRQQIADDELAAKLETTASEARRQASALEAMEKLPGEKVDAINSRIKRLEAAEGNHRKAVSELNQEIARLQALIQANEGVGVEEALDAAKVDQLRIDAQVKGFEQEAAVLRLLLDTLQSAETEAKTRYLTPVIGKVEPYLRMLLPEAAIVLDENLGITALARDGGQEDFDSLSGGTQEQIAVLTRLAFAELLTEKGHPATVILDDALAFSDDDRIERMFDILMRAGEHVQILVLTCRKRLFTRLGATTLQINESHAQGR
jgi:DNA repair exonuclease SbcCD ATPase subunit